MSLPPALQRLVAHFESKRRKPFMLTAPDGRVYLAMTYDELLQITAGEFDPAIACVLESNRDKSAPKA